MALNFRSVAKVVKAHSNNGEIVVDSISGLPLFLHEGMDIYLVPPENEFDRHRVIEHIDGHVIKLNGFNSLDLAKSLVGKTILVKSSDYIEITGSNDTNSYVGFNVYDTVGGYIGKITTIDISGMQPLWVIENDRKKHLIPAVETYIQRVEENSLYLNLPVGILDL